jgi:hypothetical protein
MWICFAGSRARRQPRWRCSGAPREGVDGHRARGPDVDHRHVRSTPRMSLDRAWELLPNNATASWDGRDLTCPSASSRRSPTTPPMGVRSAVSASTGAAGGRFAIDGYLSRPGRTRGWRQSEREDRSRSTLRETMSVGAGFDRDGTGLRRARTDHQLAWALGVCQHIRLHSRAGQSSHQRSSGRTAARLGPSIVRMP